MVVRSLPVLRDAYIRNLMNFTANVVRPDTQPDVGIIADRLQAITDRALKKKARKSCWPRSPSASPSNLCLQSRAMASYCAPHQRLLGRPALPFAMI